MSEPIKRFSVVENELPDPPYPEDTLSHGYGFDMDVARMQNSDSWVLCPVEVRPWMVMTWLISWVQRPCGSLPSNDELIASRLGCSFDFFQVHRRYIMRGWAPHSDGRMYHRVVGEKALAMLAERDSRRGWEKAREIVMRRDGLKCRYCGETDSVFHVDHIYPRSRGGNNDPNNLVVACQSCNLKKGARTPEEWLGVSLSGVSNVDQ